MKLATRINSFLPHFGNDVLAVLPELSRIGLTHVDLNYPEHAEGIPAERMRTALDEAGLAANGVALRFRGERYLDGELGNADQEVATEALQLCKDACDYCRAIGGRVVTIWLGFDGFDYSFQIAYAKVWERQRDAFRAICDYAPDLKVSIEYKPFEERSYAFIDSFGTVFAMIQDVDRPNLGATLDFCHMLMKHDNPAMAADILGARGKLFGIHLNDGYGRKDDGLMVGTSNFAKTLELLYYARVHGYDEAIYFDTFPIREQGVREAECNVAMVGRLEEIIDRLGMDSIGEVIAANDGIAVSELLLDAIR
ncbi:MAG: sugar phosphate isomerase/epimerase family protein [Acidobacteriota bacterium]|nr:sugar phosphate isomerase/epimerase family protein [Acidobacteriota bacterium]